MGKNGLAKMNRANHTNGVVLIYNYEISLNLLQLVIPEHIRCKHMHLSNKATVSNTRVETLGSTIRFLRLGNISPPPFPQK